MLVIFEISTLLFMTVAMCASCHGGRRERQRVALFCLLWLLPSFVLKAQNIYFNHLMPADGLSQISVTNVYADENGVIWMATRVGLDSYNGNAIHVYRYEADNPHSLFCNNVLRLRGDHRGHIYLLCTEGVARFDIVTQQFTTLRRGFYGDICFSDGLYMGLGNAVYRYEEGSKHDRLIVRLPVADVVTSVRLDSRRRLWIGTQNHGLYCLAGGRLSHPVQLGNITDIYEDSRHNLWVGSWSNGYWTISPDGRKVGNHGGNSFVRTFCEDNSGNIWLGTFHGLYCLDRRSGAWRKYEAGNFPGSLSNSSIWHIIRDPQGTLWIGTYFGGVNYFNPEYEIYNRYRAGEGGLSSPIVGTMAEDDNGRLWICTEGGGLNVLDRKTGAISRYSRTSSPNLKAIYFDRLRNMLWVGTHLGGLDRIRLADNSMTCYRNRPGDSRSLPSDILSDIIPYGRKLIIGSKRGVCLMDPDAKGQDVFRPLLWREGLTYAVSSLCIDPRNRLWIATEGRGVWRYDLRSGAVRRFTQKKGKGQLANNYVTDIAVDRQGTVWLATASNAIQQYVEAEDGFRTFGEAEGLEGDCVYATAPSSLHDYELLLITNRGFSVFNKRSHTFRNYNRSTGFPLATINEKAIYVSRKGEVFLGGIDGMVSFNERNLYKKPKPYVIGFSNLFVNGKEVLAGDGSGILDKALAFTPELVLSHSQRVFSIEFYTSNYIKVNGAPLRYRLKGLSNQWFPIRPGQTALSFSGLRPGRYTLQLRSDDASVKALELPVRILPPWYLSGWMLLVYVLALCLATVWLFRNYRNRIRMAESLKYEQQHVRDVEAQNQSKLRFFTNVSHEIRTPLTVIISLAENLLKQRDFPSDLRHMLLGIYRNSMQLRSLLSELLDFRKQEQGQTRLFVRQQDFARFINQTVLLFKDYAATKDVTLRVEAPASMVMWFDERQMQKVVNNLVSNALKHTPQGGTVTVSVKDDAGRHEMALSVADTGKGIPADELKHVFARFYQVHEIESLSDIGTGIGLNLTQEIVKMHHGTIEVASTVGQGTTFTVTLPTLRSAFKDEEIAPATDAQLSEAAAVPSQAVTSQAATSQAAVLQAPLQAASPEADPTEDDRASVSVEPDKAPAATVSANDVTPLQTEGEDDKPSILIVEDNDDIRELLVTLFAPFYHTLTAVDGKEGLEMVHDEMPDLVLSDVLMPNLSGIELCKAIKQDFSVCHIPVVLLTARTAAEQALEGLKTGADDYVTKPFNNDLLVSRCNNLINTRRMLQRKFSEHPHTKADLLATNVLDKQLLEQAMKIIDRFYADSSFTVDTFAREIGMSRTALFTKWKTLTGQTPKSFILNLRLRKAADMLRNRPELSIADISYANGFTSARYFCKCFKDVYKQTPTEFKAAAK